MKRLSLCLSIIASLSLAACASENTVTYQLTFSPSTDAVTRDTLSEASLRVIERRLDHLGQSLISNSAIKTGSGVMLEVTFSGDEEVAEVLTAELVAPFSMKVMAQAGEGETADITVEGHGGFIDSGINEKDLQWVDAGKNNTTNKGEVRMIFTTAGRIKMQALFQTLKGKDIGLFVRDKLVSKLHITTDTLPEDIVIRDIPTPEVAQVFADDMDVGLHVTFTPVP